ncbi:hypothetical protein M405DRAFT_886035 [Rhizopogon salebrosus TDB-379]|nr:hypothetical protein M405DRAFT_886035 [Rhizopogon salebrosus TDB-379]
MQKIIDHLPRWSTLACPGLIGNGLPEFLSSSFPVLAAGPFPSFAETNAYVKAFALPFVESGYIRLSYEVIGVKELEGGCGCTVCLKDWNTGGAVLEETWEAVVITTVWFDNPCFPDRMLVIGNASPANEMAAQLVPIASSCSPVYGSTCRVSIFPSLPDARIRDIDPITRYSTSDKITVTTQMYPTFKSFTLSRAHSHLQHYALTHALPTPAASNLYAHNPTLAFMGATISFIPFLLADLASTWLYSHGPEPYPYPKKNTPMSANNQTRLLDIVQRPITLHFPLFRTRRTFVCPSYQERHRRMRPEFGEVLAKWDDAQDTRRWAMYAAKADSLYACASTSIDVEAGMGAGLLLGLTMTCVALVWSGTTHFVRVQMEWDDGQDMGQFATKLDSVYASTGRPRSGARIHVYHLPTSAEVHSALITSEKGLDMNMKSDHIQPTTNEAPHPTSAIRSLGRNARIFVANSSCLGRRGRRRRTLGHSIVYLDGEVVDPKGEAVCEPVGSMCDGENLTRQSQEVLWHTFGDIQDIIWECAISTGELSRRWDRREDS